MGLKLRHTAASHYATAVFVAVFTLSILLQTFLSALPVHAEPMPPTEKSMGPPALSLVAPGHNTIKNGELLTYSWQPLEETDYYIFESYADAALTTQLESQQVNTATFEHFEPHGTEVWWRVKAVKTSGEESDWSEVRRVLIDNKAPSIENITEGNLTNVSATALFKFEVKDNYPDKIISFVDNAYMQTKEVRTNLSSKDAETAQAPQVTVSLALNIDTLALANGLHTLTAQAVDYAGNRSEALTVKFNVVNVPPVIDQEKPPTPAPVRPVETIQTIPLPEAPPIDPILGGEQIIAADTALPDNSAVAYAETKTVQETKPVNAHDHPVEAPRVNLGWPMWLGFGALLSGTGWWFFSGRKRP